MEKNAHVGGRLTSFQLNNTKFDLGPTLLALKFFLDQVFLDAGNRNVNDYLKFVKLDPMYRLSYNESKHVDVYSQDYPEKMKQEFARVFPEDVRNFEHFLQHEAKRWSHMLPLLQKTYLNYGSMLSWQAIRALPIMVCCHVVLICRN